MNDEISIFIVELNLNRRIQKDKWIFINRIVSGLEVRMKFFNTYIQILRINGINYFGGGEDQSVGSFNSSIKNAFQSALNNGERT